MVCSKSTIGINYLTFVPRLYARLRKVLVTWCFRENVFDAVLFTKEFQSITNGMKTTKCNRCHVKHLFWNTISYSIFWIFFVGIFEETSLSEKADNHKNKKVVVEWSWMWFSLWWITTSTRIWPSKNILIIYTYNTKALVSVPKSKI